MGLIDSIINIFLSDEERHQRALIKLSHLVLRRWETEHFINIPINDRNDLVKVCVRLEVFLEEYFGKDYMLFTMLKGLDRDSVYNFIYEAVNRNDKDPVVVTYESHEEN